MCGLTSRLNRFGSSPLHPLERFFGVFLCDPLNGGQFGLRLLLPAEAVVEAREAETGVCTGGVEAHRLSKVLDGARLTFPIRVQDSEVKMRDPKARTQPHRLFEKWLGCRMIASLQQHVTEPRRSLCVRGIVRQLSAELPLRFVIAMRLPQKIAEPKCTSGCFGCAGLRPASR